MKDPFASKMLKQDPLYNYSLKFKEKSDEEVLNKFISEYKVKHLLFDSKYEIPKFLIGNKSRVITDEFSKCKILIYE